MNLNFKNRIAWYYLFATALIIALIFVTVYLIVHKTVYNHLNEDLDTELSALFKSLIIDTNDKIIFTNPFEWEEGEHRQIEVNPTFIQVSGKIGNTIKKTPNLRNDSLYVDIHLVTKHFSDTYLSKSPVYQVQYPLFNTSDEPIGFILVAIPTQESEIVLENLRKALLISYPIILIILFFITRYIAGKSIAPINNVIKTANRITKENLNERISLPSYNDEIYLLTSTINELMDRLEDNLLREKQFTADASHELRTPLSVIKGTLEVLVRKPRDVKQYEDKINYCILETDRMTKLIDQLLFLARFDSDKLLPNIVNVNINQLLNKILQRLQQSLLDKEIKVKILGDDNAIAKADTGMMEIVFDNIISNSIKYSDNGKTINIRVNNINGILNCQITDEGFGMNEEQAKRIFDRFYRGDVSRNSDVSGFGLGLSIVKKLCEMQNIKLEFKSKINLGSTFTLSFPK